MAKGRDGEDCTAWVVDTGRGGEGCNAGMVGAGRGGVDCTSTTGAPEVPGSSGVCLGLFLP